MITLKFYLILGKYSSLYLYIHKTDDSERSRHVKAHRQAQAQQATADWWRISCCNIATCKG